MSIVQLSRFLSFFLCDSFDILPNLFRFVKNFFIFLFLLCRPSRVSLAILPFPYTVCQLFFTFFSSFSNRYKIWYIHLILSTILHQIYKNYRIFPVVFQINIKRRRRDLNPRAATNDLLPFQGSPFGQLGYFSKVSVKTRNLSVSAERVGFEPTRPFGQTVFKTASL